LIHHNKLAQISKQQQSIIVIQSTNVPNNKFFLSATFSSVSINQYILDCKGTKLFPISQTTTKNNSGGKLLPPDSYITEHSAYLG
jgi:hypothetical protein